MSSLVTALLRFKFALSFLICMLATWFVTKVLHLLPLIGDRPRREQLSIAVSSTLFWYLMLLPCPWIQLHGLRQLHKAWAEMGGEDRAPFVIANHNSKLDSLLITALLPTSLGPRMRSLIKQALFSEPLFGGICERVGHFAVHFRGSREGDFGVDKHAQQTVSARMDRFVADGGGLLIFPEGQLNRNGRQLQTFRRGAFALPIKHKKAVWAFLNVGCERCWPHYMSIGGAPANVWVKAFKVTDDASQFDATTLAEHAREVMQKELDGMYAVADGHVRKP
ncbi:unnamed protein product [Agarophyton chilense]